MIETDDLRLVYHGPTFQYLAPYTTRCFENSLALERRLFGYRPWEKITVMPNDFSDYGNAGVWTNPRNSMMIQIAPTNFVYETGPSNERINFLMSHELVHVVTADQAAGWDPFFRRAFLGKVRESSEHPETILYGYLTLPRRAAPRWFREGIAVFLETWMAGGLGRAQGPYDEMVFRTMVRDGSRIYDPLGLESEGTKTDFQVGVNSYLYGTRFLTYLAWARSPEEVLAWAGRAPGSRAYFAAQFRHVFGEPMSQGWREWLAFERGFQRANLDSVRRHPITPHRDLSAHALGSVSRAYLDPASRTLYAAVQHPGTVASIAAIPLDGGPIRSLAEVKGPALYFVCSLARDPETGLIYYTTDNNRWRDLNVLDPRTGKHRRLIEDARIGDLVFHPRDRSIWGVRHFDGISSLVRIPPPYTDYSRVVSLPYGQDAYDLDLSPDGAWLSASWAEVSGRQSLRLMSLEKLAAGDTGTRVLFDFGSSIPTSFVFSPDGRSLCGSSYYTGVSNLFRYDLTADSMDIVTNVEDGLFRPVPLDGDSAIAFRYTGDGFVPSVVPVRPLTDVSAITFLGQQLAEKHPVVKSWKLPPPSAVVIDSTRLRTGDYRPLASVRPAFLYPFVEGYKTHTAAGLHLQLSDPVGLHTFDASLSATPTDRVGTDERWHAALRYHRPDASAEMLWNPGSFYDLVGSTKTSRKGVHAGIELDRTFIRDTPRTLQLESTLSGWSGLERLPDHQNVATSADFDRLVTGAVTLEYRNTRKSIGAIDPEKGHTWSLRAEADGVRFRNPKGAVLRGFPKLSGTLELGTPVPLRNSSLWLLTAAGWSPGDRGEPFANFFFGGFGNNGLDHLEPRRYRDPERFPGIEIDEAGGTSYGKAVLDLGLPPLRFRRLGTPGLYASFLRVSLFGGGLRTDLDLAGGDSIADAGAQADLRIQLLTQQAFTLSYGYAQASRLHGGRSSGWMVSLKLPE
ncbi:MAG TPA: hypothetical protein VGK89_02635 [Candidatus Eisenbacteria bacterium]